MDLRAILLGGVLIFLLQLAGITVLILLSSFLPVSAMPILALIVGTTSVILGAAFVARRAGTRHLLHGVLAAMVCLNLVFPIIIIFGSQLIDINPATALAIIINYTLLGTIGGLVGKNLGRRRQNPDGR